MPVARRTSVVVVGLIGLFVGTPGASAAQGEPVDEPAQVTLVATAPEARHIGTTATVRARLTDAEGAPIADAPVTMERRDRQTDSWVVADDLVTDEDGAVSHDFTVQPRANRFRAVYAGDETHAPATSEPVGVRGERIDSTITLSGPARVVDERRVRLRIAWQADDGREISGRVRVLSKEAGTKRWSVVRTPRVRQGSASIRVRPRVDTVWRVVGPGSSWHRRDRSASHHIDNVPPGTPVRLPSSAPAPSIRLPAQSRAVGQGPNPVVSRIPNRVWSSMVGRSWHSGCPVGRSELRWIRLNYWGYDGYRYRGELVVNARVASRAVNVFESLYRDRYPVRSMYLVDRFGWSSKLRGANDYRSMSAGNTSAFNCREVVGRPGVRSPHSYGGSIDLNPWENPYVTRRGTFPNSWWLSRSHPRVAWRSSAHPVVQIFSRNGFRWGGGYRDYHHFQ